MNEKKRFFPAILLFLAVFLLLFWAVWIMAGGCASTVEDVTTTVSVSTSTTSTSLVTTTTKLPIVMELLVQKTGAFPGAGLGYSLAGGDLNGDRSDEYLLGAPYVAHSGSPEVGTVYVYSGSGALLYQKYGQDAHEKLGGRLAVGDFDGNGKADFIASTLGTAVRSWVYIYNGETGNMIDAKSDDSIGTSLASGDLDSDGKDDFIAGLPLLASNGWIYIFSLGKSIYAQPGASWQPQLGLSAACGDVNGDGYSDYIVGSTNKFFVYSGKDNTYIYGKQGPPEGTTFASALAAADIDGDGRAEVIAGDPYASSPTSSEAGAVFVYSGNPPQLLYTKYGEVSGSRFGYSLAVGDVDGDGAAEVVVGAPETSFTGDTVNGRGAVYVLSGAGGTQIWQQYSDHQTVNFGFAVACADVNGDGLAEVLVSDPSADAAGKFGCGLVKIYKKK